MALHFSRRDFLPAGLKADQIELVENTIRIHSHSAKTAAACPHCGTISRHVHSRYRRRPADLPAHGRAVELVLLVRRFRCRAMNCSAKIFAERFPPAVTRPYERRTARLQGLVRHLGLALGGRPAQALAARLQLPASKDTFLRSIRSTAEAASSELRVIGIDDWAWRKGQRYGTLICDLERRRVIDLLPDREPATVEAWLRAAQGSRSSPATATGAMAGLCMQQGRVNNLTKPRDHRCNPFWVRRMTTPWKIPPSGFWHRKIKTDVPAIPAPVPGAADGPAPGRPIDILW